MTGLAAPQQATRTSRNRLLWEEEARAIRTNAQSLSPAARHTVRAVLEAILREREEGEIAASARSLLAALERLERELGEVEAGRRALADFVLPCSTHWQVDRKESAATRQHRC